MSLNDVNVRVGSETVPFPFPAYDAQRQVMGSVLSAIFDGQHALLESPTGTGKSLALLCSTLHWQHTQKSSIRNSKVPETELQDDSKAAFGVTSKKSEASMTFLQPSLATVPPVPLQAPAPPMLAPEGNLASGREEEGSDDCLAFVRRHITGLREVSKQPRRNGMCKSEQAANAKVSVEPRKKRRKVMRNTRPMLFALPETHRSLPSCELPKVFYCTRTHSQIQQLVQELRKAGLRPFMNILGSRSRYCINARVLSVANKGNNLGEMCDKLAMVFNGCEALHRTHLLIEQQMARRGELWDVEDLVKRGISLEACPYYTSRDLVVSAELIFCTYPYLLDPVIRHETKLEGQLAGAVVVFDEAHNIDEICRDGTSFSTDVTVLRRLVDEDLLPYCSSVGSATDGELVKAATTYDTLHTSERPGVQNTTAIFDFCSAVIRDLLAVVQQDSEECTGDQATGHRVRAAEFLRQFSWLSNVGLLRESQQLFFGLGVTFNPYNISVPGLAALKSLLQVLLFLAAHIDDYVYLVRVAQRPPRVEVGLHCMNAGIGFEHLRRDVRTTVLASGTLSPMHFVATELRHPFAHRLQATHVVDLPRQVCALTLGVAPTGAPLRGTFQHAHTAAYHAALGQALLALCRAIPQGVLCFLPSYALLDAVVRRWRASPLWAQLQELKSVFVEPKNAASFGQVMAAYRERCLAGTGGGGALFLAVCRGKVSEGLDFKDGMARGVLVASIPFASVGDPLVDQKRRYNTRQACRHPGEVMSGDEWYLMDAFRALNQALGRCIRHAKDFGCIALLDERFSGGAYDALLPCWLRPAMEHITDFRAAHDRISRFFSLHGVQPQPFIEPLCDAAAPAEEQATALPEEPASVSVPVEQVVATYAFKPLQPLTGRSTAPPSRPQPHINRAAADAGVSPRTPPKRPRAAAGPRPTAAPALPRPVPRPALRCPDVAVWAARSPAAPAAGPPLLSQRRGSAAASPEPPPSPEWAGSPPPPGSPEDEWPAAQKTLQELGLALTPSLRALLRRCDGDVAAVLDQLEDSPVP